MPLSEALGRERCIMQIANIRQIRKDLEDDIREGELAAAYLRNIEEGKK